MTNTYKGLGIGFREADEVWVCSDLGLENKSIKALKAQIDEHKRKERRANIQALYLDMGYWDEKASLKQVTVTTLAETRYQEEAWIVEQDKSRSKVALSKLFPMEAKDALTAYIAEEKAIKAAKAANHKKLGQIEHFTKATLLAAKQSDDNSTNHQGHRSRS